MEQNAMARVVVNNETRTVAIGTKLSELLGISLPCGGHGKCGKCRVRAQGMLSAVSSAEEMRLTADELAGGIRLACCTEIAGDCSVALLKAGATDHQILTQTGKVNDVLAPSFEQYGAAIDIGTTTLAAQLYDVSGRLLAECGQMNPQSVWGADVISRIEASMKGESEKMASAVCRAIDGMLASLAKQAGIHARQIDGLVLTGNTAMLHFLTDTSPEPLSHAPFHAERLFGETLRADVLGLAVPSSQAKVYLPPCIAAFVGADTVCALLAIDLPASENALLADIGTNGEMALWHHGTLSVCSTAAGPAFEGVGISMGMSGAVGAIDRVILQNNHLTAHTIGEGSPRGICGSGLIDAVACLLETETLDETGVLEDDPAEIAAPVVLTQQDIRMVQLAKSAICAGIRTLLHHAQLAENQVSTFFVAGGFGNYLDIQNAGKIGLIPAELTQHVKVVGNAALAGAAMLLLNRNKRADALEIAGRAISVDLASNPVFAEHYMTGMLF